MIVENIFQLKLLERVKLIGSRKNKLFNVGEEHRWNGTDKESKDGSELPAEDHIHNSSIAEDSRLEDK